MVCNLHPNRQASSTCEICGQPFCEECLVEVEGKFYCKEHVAQLVSPPPASPYGPHGHHNPYASHNPYANPYGEAPQNINIYNAPQNGYYGPHYGFYPYKNKVVALLLCIFLGIAGFHRFYVGKIGTGLLYLFTGGFFLVGWLIDIILIVSGSFRDSHGYPLI